MAADAAAELEYAGEVLDLMGVSSDPDETYGDEAPLVSMVSAANLASLHNDVVTMTSTAERAAADREWAFGHVIVDEAQELSPMAWRMVMRRCPVRSMTLVGDLAQTSDAAGASSWDRVLKPYARQQLRIEELTVNYRTPAEIMDVAEPTLARIDPEAQPPRSVRESGVAPWHRQVDAAELAEVAATLAAQDHAEAGEGTLAIIVPHAVRDAVAAAVHQATHTAEPGDGAEDLRDGVSVLTVRDAKGLEFDRVIVADPNGILTESDRGLNDLYVALTRATQQLGVLHTGPLPVVLHRLKGAAA
jgi:DNA helicase IV